VAATPVLTGRSTPLALTAPLTGATTLDLVLDDGGDGNGNDHADWAAALLHC
jgi:endo-alpha-N-acetylgalactosaminidase